MRTKKQPTIKEQIRKHEEKCRRNMPAEEFKTLTFGMTTEQIAELSGYSTSTVKRWFTEDMQIPYAVQQLFKLRQNGVIGKEWKDWKIGTDGLLYHPFWRRGFTGHELAGMWYEIQTKTSLEREVSQLKKTIEEMSEKIDEQEKLIYFYKSQVLAEAKLGMCMARIMA